MNEHRDEFEEILGKALERITQLNEANASLTIELADAHNRLASHGVDPQTASRLQEENDDLKGQAVRPGGLQREAVSCRDSRTELGE